jgi:hypothetical protein
MDRGRHSRATVAPSKLDSCAFYSVGGAKHPLPFLGARLPPASKTLISSLAPPESNRHCRISTHTLTEAPYEWGCVPS